MKLFELQPGVGSNKDTKRKGRGHGSGNGKTAGRGHKGQNARSGGGVRKSSSAGSAWAISGRSRQRLKRIHKILHFFIKNSPKVSRL